MFWLKIMYELQVEEPAKSPMHPTIIHLTTKQNSSMDRTRVLLSTYVLWWKEEHRLGGIKANKKKQASLTARLETGESN